MQLGVNIRKAILNILNVFCPQNPLHECHMSFCMTQCEFDHQMKKTYWGTLILINVQLRVGSLIQLEILQI